MILDPKFRTKVANQVYLGIKDWIKRLEMIFINFPFLSFFPKILLKIPFFFFSSGCGSPIFTACA
jgi:hypothetical protein